MTSKLSPKQVLFEESGSLPIVAVCDHYAGRIDLLKKSFAHQAVAKFPFDITCDLEDGASVGNEEELLESFLVLLRSPDNAKRAAGIRIHDFHHPRWKEEVEKIIDRVGDIVSHITVPKAQDSESVAIMVEYLQKRCELRGVKRKIPVHVMIETPGALHEVWQISELPWIRGLDFGLMDFVSSHYGAIPSRCMESPGQFEHQLLVRAKTEIVAAALANNLVPTHNVTTNYKDPSLAGADARTAKERFGFARMWSIHPAQITPISEALQPDFSELAKAAEVILAGSNANWAPIAVRGVLHDRASYRYFWTLLERAHHNGMALPEDAAQFFVPQRP